MLVVYTNLCAKGKRHSMKVHKRYGPRLFMRCEHCGATGHWTTEFDIVD